MIRTLLLIFAATTLWANAYAENTKAKTMTTTNTVNVRVFDQKGQLLPPVPQAKVIKSDAEWRALRNVCR